MINVCQHPLMSRVNIRLNNRTIEQCSACSVAVRLVEEPVEISQVGDWVPEVYTGHLQAYYAGRQHDAKTPPTPITTVNENYFEREFENLRTQARGIQTQLNRLSREFYSVLHRERIKRKQADCRHEVTYEYNIGNGLVRKCVQCNKYLWNIQ